MSATLNPTGADIAKEAVKLRIDSRVVPAATWERAVRTELEHADVVAGDLGVVAKIALAHLKEDPYYYSVLARTEPAAEEYWSQRGGPPPVQLGVAGGAGPEPPRWVQTALLAAVVMLIFVLVWWCARAFWPQPCQPCLAAGAGNAGEAGNAGAGESDVGVRYWGALDPENIILFHGRDRRDPRDMRGYWGATPWPGWPSYDPAMIGDSAERAVYLPGRA